MIKSTFKAGDKVKCIKSPPGGHMGCQVGDEFIIIDIIQHAEIYNREFLAEDSRESECFNTYEGNFREYYSGTNELHFTLASKILLRRKV